MIGHSMCNGTVTDATWSGAAVQSGWTLRTAGANAANYPTGASPGQGLLPYLVEEAIAQGASSGNRYIARRATNGIGIGASTDTLIAGLRDDVETLAQGDPDVIVVWIGANDAQDAAEYAAFVAPTGLRRMLLLLRAEFPASILALYGERTTDAGNYPYVADGAMNAHKQALAAEIPYTVYVPADAVDLADAIHPSAVGYADMASRVADLWLGQ